MTEHGKDQAEPHQDTRLDEVNMAYGLRRDSRDVHWHPDKADVKPRHLESHHPKHDDTAVAVLRDGVVERIFRKSSVLLGLDKGLSVCDGPPEPDRRRPEDHIIVVCHNISVGQPAYQHLANNFRGRVDFVKELPDTEDAEANLMNVLQRDRKKQKLVILDDVDAPANLSPSFLLLVDI
mmetsp:Transcript_37194/g.97528  ORF Transcript_37194/g.97528 Transcript_37194/m.97528 type:complete len:179 (+) Transcript_37194:374-910(+)